MYEKPKIALAGKITEMIQGIAYLGADMDGSLMPDWEFEDDETTGAASLE